MRSLCLNSTAKISSRGSLVLQRLCRIQVTCHCILRCLSTDITYLPDSLVSPGQVTTVNVQQASVFQCLSGACLAVGLSLDTLPDQILQQRSSEQLLPAMSNPECSSLGNFSDTKTKSTKMLLFAQCLHPGRSSALLTVTLKLLLTIQSSCLLLA